jgi:hypothetical protein
VKAAVVTCSTCSTEKEEEEEKSLQYPTRIVVAVPES